MHHSLITTKKKESFSSRFSRKLNNERFELQRKKETEKGLKDLYHGLWKKGLKDRYQHGGWDPSHIGAVLRSNVSLLHLSRLSAYAYVRGILSSDWNTRVRARSVLRFGKES